MDSIHTFTTPYLVLYVPAYGRGIREHRNETRGSVSKGCTPGSQKWQISRFVFLCLFVCFFAIVSGWLFACLFVSFCLIVCVFLRFFVLLIICVPINVKRLTKNSKIISHLMAWVDQKPQFSCVPLNPTTFEVSFLQVITIANVFTPLK